MIIDYHGIIAKLRHVKMKFIKSVFYAVVLDKNN